MYCNTIHSEPEIRPKCAVLLSQDLVNTPQNIYGARPKTKSQATCCMLTLAPHWSPSETAINDPYDQGGPSKPLCRAKSVDNTTPTLTHFADRNTNPNCKLPLKLTKPEHVHDRHLQK